MEKQEKKLSPYRWVAVLCIGLMHAALMGAVACPGAYAPVFMGEWGVSQGLFVQLTLISFLTGALFSVPFGMLADKFGVVKILGAGMVVAAIAGISRVVCDAPGTFAGLYASSFFVGVGLAGMNANSVKFLRAWFGDKVTTGMTLYVSGAGIGVTGMMMYASSHIDNMRATYLLRRRPRHRGRRVVRPGPHAKGRRGHEGLLFGYGRQGVLLQPAAHPRLDRDDALHGQLRCLLGQHPGRPGRQGD